MPEFIYNQTKISKDQWRYGLRSSAATGCGWIATYNALHLLGKDVNIQDLISFYEHQLPLISGNLGTPFWGPLHCFRHWGFEAKLYVDIRKFDEAAKNAPASILFFRWRRGIQVGAHFAACRYNGQQFIGFNTFKYSKGPDPLGDIIQAFLKRNSYFGAMLLTIQDKPTR